MEEPIEMTRGLGNPSRSGAREKIDVAHRYMGKMRSTFLSDPLGYMLDVPSRNRGKAIAALQRRLDRLVTTPTRKDDDPPDPHTMTESAKRAQITGLGMH